LGMMGDAADNIQDWGVGEVTAKNSWQNMGLWKIF
jgi:hypothetical protein